MERKGLRVLALSFYFMALTLAGTGVYAQNASPGESKWEFELIPYLWMSNISGDVTIEGSSSHAKLKFGDIFSDLQFGGQVHLEARKDRWGLFLDTTYLNLKTEEWTTDPNVGPINTDFGMKEWLLEFGALYQLGRWSLGKAEGPALALDALGGGRYWYLSGDLDVYAPLVPLSFSSSGSKDWIDPFVGLRLRLNLTKNLLLVLRGDVGGFSVGSQFSWSASAILGYSISRVVSVGLGYRALYVDYESGSGSDKFEYKVTMYGPVVGVGFYF